MGFREGMFLLRALLAVAGGARQRGGGIEPMDVTHMELGLGLFAFYLYEGV